MLTFLEETSAKPCMIIQHYNFIKFHHYLHIPYLLFSKQKATTYTDSTNVAIITKIIEHVSNIKSTLKSFKNLFNSILLEELFKNFDAISIKNEPM